MKIKFKFESQRPVWAWQTLWHVIDSPNWANLLALPLPHTGTLLLYFSTLLTILNSLSPVVIRLRRCQVEGESASAILVVSRNARFSS